MIQASQLSRAAALAAALFILLCSPTLALAAPSAEEQTPVNLPTTTQPAGDAGSSSGSLVRTIVGLAVVIAVIYGIAWVLRQLKQSRVERGSGGLASVASVGLGAGKALHLVRAGRELVLVGVADHGVTPVRAYSEEEAREAGLVDEWGEIVVLEEAAEPTAEAAPTAAPSALLNTMRRWTVRR